MHYWRTNHVKISALFSSFRMIELCIISCWNTILKCPHWQAAGAVGGALTIMEVMPDRYKHMIEGPSLKVDTHAGAIAEGVLTFVITFIVLLILLKGPQNAIFKTLLLAIATVAIIMPGSAYTGPSLNPANVSCLFHFHVLFWF